MSNTDRGRAIDRVWADRAQRIVFWLASWRATWPMDGRLRTLEPDAEKLEFLIADISDASVEAALRRTVARVPPGGSRPAAAFLNECARRRSDSWRTAARSAWLLDLLCPDCEAPALQLVIAESRPHVRCLDCGHARAVARVRL